MKISTFGDSLTQGRGGWRHEFTYQAWLAKYLQPKIKSEKIQINNLGISGQTMLQIANRLEKAFPADFITFMGGTNDIWHFLGPDPSMEEEMANNLIQILEENVIANFNSLSKSNPEKSVLILSTIPPIANVPTLTPQMQPAILDVNQRIRKLVEEHNQPNLLLCDVHGAMQNETEFMRPGLSVPDGVHFTKEGDRVCGETFGQTIFQYLQTMHSNET